MAGWFNDLISLAWRELVRRAGAFGLFTLFLLQVSLFFVSEGVEDVVRGIEPVQGRLFFVSLVGLLAGWRLGRSRKGWLWIPFWMAVGTPVVLIQMGMLWSELMLVVQTGLARLAEILPAIFQREAISLLPPPEALQLAWADFSTRAFLETVELRNWLADLFRGSPAFRTGAVQLAWGLLLYWLAVWAGMVSRRTENSLLALLPAGSVLAGLLAYARSERLGMLVLFMLGVLVLYAGETQRNNEIRWDRQQLDYPVDMRLDFSLSTSVLIAGILVVAYIVPQINIRSAFRSLVGLDHPASSSSQGDGLAESLGIERPTDPPPFFTAYQDGGLPRSQLLGSGPELAFEEALHVRIIGQGLGDRARYYWRSLTYDEYTGLGWITGLTRSVRYGRGQQMPPVDQIYLQPLRQEVRVLRGNSEVVYAAGEIVTLDRSFEVAWRVPVVEAYDPFAVRVSTDNYQVDLMVPLRIDNLLRTAGTDYPEWVRDRYLQLPDGLPFRVRELAEDITTGASNPYDRAVALELFLRGFTYNLSLPAPPQDRDLVAYFLFELQQGYCDYYASAMVVMARALGIPARLAVGYAQGEYDPQADRYVVMALDAHSWPELYFPGFGWLPFEPTAGVAAIDRSASVERLPEQPGESDLPPLADRLNGWLVLFRWLAAAVGLVVFFLAAWGVLEWLRLGRLTREAFYRQMFAHWAAYRRHLLQPGPAGMTPAELTASLAAYFDRPFRNSRLLRRLPGSVGDLLDLGASYNRMQYAPEKPDEKQVQQDIRLWRRLRLKLWIAALQERWRGKGIEKGEK